MTALGSILIISQASVTEARAKLKCVCELFTGEAAAATRVGIAVSELARSALQQAPGSRLEIEIEVAEEGQRTHLRLTLASPVRVELPESLGQFFPSIVERSQGGEYRQVLSSELRSVQGWSGQQERQERQATEIVRQKSRGELLEELQARNRELRQSFENLKRTTSAKERMEGELNIGRDIQMGMLPVDFEDFSRRPEFDVFAALHPAREVGGDFYDFFLIDDDRLCICVGDVSGKGVPAALFMAMTKTLIKSRATNDLSPASILTHVNDELGRSNESCMFVTIWAAILNVKSGKLTFCNAGHNPPYVRRGAGGIDRLNERHGPVVAAMEGMTFGEAEITLSPGDELVLYTDGVTEAMDVEGRLYGDERLVHSLSGEIAGVESTVSAVVEAAWRFQGDADQADDITVMAVRYQGDPGGTGAHVLELRIANRLEEIGSVVEAFQDFATRHGVSDKVRRTMCMAFDELLNNIVSYGYEDEGAHAIEVRVELDPSRLSLTVTDEGKPFNPFARSAPDTTLSIEERQVGGLGIHLVRSLMDEVHYFRRTDRNVVIVVKTLGTGS